MYNQCTIGSTGIILQKLMLQVSNADGRQYSNAENTHVSHLYHAKHLCPKQSQLSPMVDDEPSLRACEPLAAVCWNAFVLEQNCRQAQEAAKEEQLLNGEFIVWKHVYVYVFYIYISYGKDERETGGTMGRAPNPKPWRTWPQQQKSTNLTNPRMHVLEHFTQQDSKLWNHIIYISYI